MRFATFLLAIAVSSPGCRTSCPETVDLSTPEATIRSFHRAFSCDDKELEYRCFSDDVKRSFGSIFGYSIGREVFRRENEVLVLLLEWTDLDGRIQVEMDKDGNRALARVDAGAESSLLISLQNEPEYRLHFADGSELHEFADRVTAKQFEDSVLIAIYDRHLAGEPRKPIQRVEMAPRWTLAGVPGLEAALESAGQTRP